MIVDGVLESLAEGQRANAVHVWQSMVAWKQLRTRPYDTREE